MANQLDISSPINPYHYILHCFGGKWKMTILHEIHTFGKIRFNQTRKYIPISEKVLAQQLRELVNDNLIRRISFDSIPPRVEYELTPSGEEVIQALDILYVWSLREMVEHNIPIDENTFVVHKSEKYADAIHNVSASMNFNLKIPEIRNPHPEK